MTQVRIIAIAPTQHQHSSLKNFGLPIIDAGNGAFHAENKFDTWAEAEGFLLNRADLYNSEDPNGSDDRLFKMYEDVERRGQLTLDAVTARIEEIIEIDG